MGAVSLRDGVRIECSTGETVVADAEDPTGDVNVLSHAHGDHLYHTAPTGVVCSELTATLARVRRDEDDAGRLERTIHPRVEQVPAGHVPGSQATVVEDADGTTYCYTGDVSTRDRFYLDGFDAGSVDADVLITEATYGDPEYVLPPQDVVEAEVVDFLDDTDAPVILFGYTLGRAQELQLLVGRSDRHRLLVTEAIERINAPVADHYGVDFGAERYGRDVDLGTDDALVLPAQTNRLSFVESIRDATGAVTVGASGWAVDSSFRYRGDYDATFALSDHCGFAELCELVEAVDPDRVYTQHGSADALASHLDTVGYDARALKRNQTSLGDF